MSSLARDVNKNIAVFINDFDQEFADALMKLSAILGRELHGVVLIDSAVKAENRNTPDTEKIFKQIECDFSDDAALRSTIKALEANLLLVTCSSDRNQPYFQRILPHMPYVLGPTESSLTWATHKHLMRTMMEAYDPSLVPKFQMIESAMPSELEKVSSRLEFPVIIKPTGLAASILVSRAENEAELKKIAVQSFKVLSDIYRRDNGRGKPAMIVEEYINGDMYTVDAYVNEVGHVWTLPFLRAKTAHVLGREGFYEFQADSLIELDATELDAGRRAAESAIHALGLRSSAAHIEMFHTNKGWKIIELGPRAGGQRQDIYLASYGIDHALNELLVKIGLVPEITVEHKAYTTTIYLYSDQEGVISAIEGVDEARRNPSIYNLNVNGKPGQLALNSQNGGKWIVRGLLANADHEQLYRDAEAVRSSIKITTELVK